MSTLLQGLPSIQLVPTVGPVTFQLDSIIRYKHLESHKFVQFFRKLATFWRITYNYVLVQKLIYAFWEIHSKIFFIEDLQKLELLDRWDLKDPLCVEKQSRGIIWRSLLPMGHTKKNLIKIGQSSNYHVVFCDQAKIYIDFHCFLSLGKNEPLRF